MRRILLFVAMSVMVSCTSRPATEDLGSLSGYWEIERVVSDKGNKEYSVNETIDHFTVKGTEGTRTKVRPRLDGTYERLGSETFKVIDSTENMYLEYHLHTQKWAEQVIKLTDESLVLRSKNDIEYHFKRPIPFSIK